MTTNLGLWDLTEGHPEARAELEQYRAITEAAIASVKSTTAGEIIETHLRLKTVLREAGEI